VLDAIKPSLQAAWFATGILRSALGASDVSAAPVSVAADAFVVAVLVWFWELSLLHAASFASSMAIVARRLRLSCSARTLSCMHFANGRSQRIVLGT